ncbi:MAG: YHS domain-containing (seleno)protein [Polymorphobacter sp.]
MLKAFLMAMGLAFAALAPAASPAVAATWTGAKGDQPAVSGYDPVAYFAGAPAVGDAALSHVFEGATYRFASVANRAAFIANPEKYAPQFGGYCAWAASQGRLAGPDPTIWHIVDGKLYLNCSKDADAKWLADRPGNIAKAEAFWDAHEYGAEP